MYQHEGLVVLRRDERPKDLFVKIFKNKVYKRNENVIISIIGKTGSGKSYTALSLANMFENFSYENIVFTSKDFFRLVNSGKLKKGSVIIYDEAEVDLDNLTFWDKLSRFFSYMMATIRYRNYIIIFTMPYKDDIIKKVRRLIHYTVECTNRKNREKGYNIVKIMEVLPNFRTGKIYDKYLRVIQGKKVYKVRALRVYMPPKHLIDMYEAMKHPYVEKLYKDMEEEMLETEKVGQKSLTPLEEMVYYMILKGNPKTLMDLSIAIYGEFNKSLNSSRLSKLRANIKKKGYNLSPKDSEYMDSLRNRVDKKLWDEPQMQVVTT